MKKYKFIWIATVVLLYASVTVALAQEPSYDVPLNPSHEEVTNSEFETGTCPTPPEGQEGWWGWHFIMPSNANFLSLSVTFADAGTFSADPFPGSVFVAAPDNSHAYIWTLTDDTLVSGFATSDKDVDKFNLSHVCPGEEQEEHLTVSKTAVTSYKRTHSWDIAKKVETENNYMHEGYPKVWLFIDGHGDETATWTVDVTYEGYEDSEHNVSGEITIENTGTLDAVITNIDDVLAGNSINVTCDGDLSLAVGETLTCTYDEDVNSKIEGSNVVTVTTESGGSYDDTAPITWGDPTTEVNATVTIKDLSDLFGKVELGTATAPNDAQFTYTKDFTWADYGADGCGDYRYDNTAKVIGDADEVLASDDATLKVNVQCYVYETAYAMGNPADCFSVYGFSQWGWTNPIGPGSTYEWPLWAGAGQCDTSKGTLVGTVMVNYNGTTVTVTYNVNSPYLQDETHVYVGSNPVPLDKKGKQTVAPGQYTNSGANGGTVYVIAHAVVGLPDPDFGP